MMIQIGVVGDSVADERLSELAREVGSLIARRGWVLVCGGMTGVMEAAARGAKSQGGVTVGILPVAEKVRANRFVDIVIPTGMGHARNALIALASDALVAVGGGYGTLSEIALARKMGKKVVSLSSWEVAPDIETAETPEEALEVIIKAVGQ